MAALRLGTALVALAASTPGAAENVATWQPLIDAASQRCGVPATWIARVMQAESAGRTSRDGRPIRSRVGAIGLMQLMPATWIELRRNLGLGANPDDPRDNILAGACYLRAMYDRFGYPGLFAAYNAGPARYAAHLASGAALPGETIAYLAKVGGAPPTQVAAAGPVRDPLFAVRNAAAVAPPPSGPPAPFASLFVVRRDGS